MTGWTEEGIITAWRALSRQEGAEIWRFVHLSNLGSVSVEAGCHFPLGREALIVSFPDVGHLDSAKLPEGKGFDVTTIEGQTIFSECTAVALTRQPEGPFDIFAIMVVDVLRLLEADKSETDKAKLTIFLDRVKAWQEFMAKGRRPLSPDAQIGLLGELWMLRLLLDSSLGFAALDCWQGPMRAAQDFHIAGGALEVKSTVQKNSFLAKINSIDQLDCERSPLYLCALRFSEDEEGISLIDIVQELRELFRSDGRERAFNAPLMLSGYLDEHSTFYARKVNLKKSWAILVSDDMPRLTRALLPVEIRSARYVLDLDAIQTPSIELTRITAELGLE